MLGFVDGEKDVDRRTLSGIRFHASETVVLAEDTEHRGEPQPVPR